MLCILVVPVDGKYTIRNLTSQAKTANEIEVYHDINNDGNSEFFRFIKNWPGRLAVIGEANDLILFQWNITGIFPPRDFYCFEDYNADGYKELFVFTYHADSIFLHGYDINKDQTFTEDLFISTFSRYRDTVDIHITQPVFVDLEGNGRKKLLISLYCGFSITARKLILVDIDERKVISSPVAGSSIREKRLICDLDGDGLMEISGEIPINGNTPFDYPYSDQYGWLFVYNHQLQYKFPPCKINSYSGEITVNLLHREEEPLLAVLSRNYSKTDSCKFLLYNATGDLVTSKTLPEPETLRRAYFKTMPEENPDHIILYRGNGTIEHYNQNLNLKKTIHGYPFDRYVTSLDINDDGRNEEIFISRNKEKFILTQHDFDHATLFDYDDVETILPYFSIISRAGHHPALFLSLDNSSHSFSWMKNWKYSYRYFIWSFIVMLNFTAVYFLGKLFQLTLKRRYNAENQLRHFQIRALEQQLNPHFTLNILNNIGALYEKQDIVSAQYYFGKYSKLLRNVLINSGNITTTLEQELEFTKNFLELEHLRMNRSFMYFLEKPEAAETVTLPKLLVQTFADNAIRHGIRPLSGEKVCMIFIGTQRKTNELIITIADDGIGRSQSSRLKPASTQKGLKIMNEHLKLYAMYEGKFIYYRINDYSNDSLYPGTLVTITIPLS